VLPVAIEKGRFVDDGEDQPIDLRPRACVWSSVAMSRSGENCSPRCARPPDLPQSGTMLPKPLSPIAIGTTPPMMRRY
jgi:hypothetical protein